MLAVLKTPRMANTKALEMHGDIGKSPHSCKHLDGSLYDELVRTTSGNHSKKRSTGPFSMELAIYLTEKQDDFMQGTALDHEALKSWVTAL
jgi:hypothetical protein